MPILSVPYVSQTDTQANLFKNDCGVACVAMVKRFYNVGESTTVNNLARRTKLAKADRGLLPSDLIVLLGLGGISAYAKHSLSLQALREEIDKGKPVILLVNYKHFGGKAFGHYALLIGYEGDEFIWHDPYLKGANFRMDAGTFLKAITDVKAYFYFTAQGVLLN